MHLAATMTFGGTLAEKLQAIASAGFDGVELTEVDLLSYPDSIRNVKALAASLNLRIPFYQPMRDFEGCPREQLTSKLGRINEMFDVMEELGAETLLVCSNVSVDASASEQLLVDDLGTLANLAEKRGFQVGYEALSWGRHIRTFHDAWRLVNKVGHAKLGLVLDTFHTFAINDELSRLSALPVECIFLVQIADAPKLSIDVLQWSRRFRCFPGNGDFALTKFLEPLFLNGYQGPLSLEIFSDTYSLMPPQPLAREGFASLSRLAASARENLVV